MNGFPALPENREPTRATLHAYAHAVAALPRAHAAPHPRWWHISLSVRPDGLSTDAIRLPGGDAAFVRMDPRVGEVVFETSQGDRRSVPMDAGLTATEMGDALIAAASEFGLSGDYDRARYESADARPYDADDAQRIFGAFVAAAAAIADHRSRIPGEVGPIQLWPHGFDLAFEWFGTRRIASEEGGESTEAQSQLNLGFYPAGDAYFYSNPWPFDAARLLRAELPHGARWKTDGWQGSILEYSKLSGSDDGVDRFLDYAAAVFDAAVPTLRA